LSKPRCGSVICIGRHVCMRGVINQ
jgi:hypothetical protein